jgi:hypothetical protein
MAANQIVSRPDFLRLFGRYLQHILRYTARNELVWVVLTYQPAIGLLQFSIADISANPKGGVGIL